MYYEIAQLKNFRLALSVATFRQTLCRVGIFRMTQNLLKCPRITEMVRGTIIVICMEL